MPHFWYLKIGEEEFFGDLGDGSLEEVLQKLEKKGIVVDIDYDVEYE